MPYDIQLKRIYAPVEKTDGARVLVDRLWPRGKRREDLALTEWYRDASPSPALRRAWHKDEMDAETFAQHYRQELAADPLCLTPLMRYARQGRLTLVTASREPEQSHLPVLRAATLDALEQEDDEVDDREPSSPTCYNR